VILRAGGVLIALGRLHIHEGLTPRMQELHDALLAYELRQSGLN
jgi:hypothetical protein